MGRHKKRKKRKRQKTDNSKGILKRLSLSRPRRDGLASLVQVCKFPRKPKLGNFIPVCHAEAYAIALEPAYCREIRCPDYGELYILDGEHPFPGKNQPHSNVHPDEELKLIQLEVHVEEGHGAVAEFSCPSTSRGPFMPVCRFHHHPGIALDPQVCETRQCSCYRRLYLNDSERPYQEE
jgi:hypothetical protein